MRAAAAVEGRREQDGSVPAGGVEGSECGGGSIEIAALMVGGGLFSCLSAGGAFGGGFDGGVTVDVAVGEFGHDGLECLIEVGLDSGGISDDVQLDDAAVTDLDGVHCEDDVGMRMS